MDHYIPFILIPFIAWGVRHYLQQKNDFTPLKKRTLTWGITAFFITEMGRSFYRPYIYKNQINDFFIADTIGNSFGTVTAIFMILTLSGSGTISDWKIIVMLVAGLVAYEFLNLTGHHAVDHNDLIATLVFGALSTFVYAILLRKYGHPEISGNNDQNKA